MRRSLFIALFLISVMARGQFTPPAIGGYAFNGGVWSPLTSSATTGGISYVPPASALYGYNVSTGLWYPCSTANPCSGAGGGGSGVSSINGTTGAFTFTGAVTCTTTTCNFTAGGGGSPGGSAGAIQYYLNSTTFGGAVITGPIKGNGASAPSVSLYSDIVALWASCTGINALLANGTCGASGGMVYPGAGIPNSTGSAWGTSYGVFGSGSVLLGSGAVGSAAYTASSAYDAAGAAAAALVSAETYSSNASNLTSGTVAVGRLPTGIPNANLANASTAVNGQTCLLGGSCTITAAPPTDVRSYAAAVCDGGTASASALTRYDNNQPVSGCVVPASDTTAYLSYAAPTTGGQAQYAQQVLAAPGYWTGTSLYLNFYATVISGAVEWLVQTACTAPNSVVGTSTWSTPFATTTTVSTTASGSVVTALISGIAGPGVNGCPSSPTVPTVYKYRVYRLPYWSSAVAYQIGDLVTLSGNTYTATAASTNQTPPNASYWSSGVTTTDTAAGAVYLTSVTVLTARSQ